MSRSNRFSLISLSETEWGPIKILRPLPKDGDQWGALSEAKGTDWEPFLRVVPGSVLSNALHGYTKPLFEQLGKAPLTVARKVPDDLGYCRGHTHQTCLFRKDVCRPGAATPECYEPNVDSMSLEEALYEVVMAWKEGTYVLVIEGKEFSI